MNFPHIKKSFQINGKEISLEIGRFAAQANASVLARTGDTLVLATVTSCRSKEDLGYFPLFVEYQEKLYAGGKIKGSRWVKREGRPSDEATLTARLIDRSIRPLFPKDYKDQVQVVITILSFDSENHPDVLSTIAVSAALSISDIPWNGPIGVCRVGFKDSSFFVNPVYQELEFSDLDLIVSGTDKDIIMIEAGANEVAEDKLIGALEYGQKAIAQMVSFINKLQKDIGLKKQTFEIKKPEAKLVKEIEKKAAEPILDVIKQGIEGKLDLSRLEAIKEALAEDFVDKPKSQVVNIVDNYFKKLVRDQVLTKKKRIDGRKPDEIRPLSMEVGLLPRTHGSAVFQRGLTQALTITTLGSPSLEQWIEGLGGEETKRYIHHYYMPPYSVGETGRFGWPSRREVGHGALAERALEPVIPSEEKFPYTIRVVSEITSSNGSTSMASVCGSSLSLMDAGVPIKKAVAGIAMGMMTKLKAQSLKLKADDYVILTDILGLEDFIGDMDFKVAGTQDGVTALQMDVKILGITPEILTQGLKQAKQTRMFILSQMEKVLPAPRSSVSKYAPKIAVLQIDKEKIGDVIGGGGKTIRKIINETGVAMDVDDEGIVTISGMDKNAINRAVAWVEGLTREVQVGEEFTGEVKRIQPFGAFVEILPGKEGLVHVSKMSADFVKNPADIVNIGQKVKVKVVEIDDMGRVNLSMLFGSQEQKFQKRSQPFQKPEPKKPSSIHFDKKF